MPFANTVSAHHVVEKKQLNIVVARQLIQIWCKALEDAHDARRRVAGSD